MGVFYFILALVALLIAIAFALYAGGIAEDKGYSKGAWIAICLIFGVIGYILVAALPDLAMRATLKNIEEKLAKYGNDSCYLKNNSNGYFSKNNSNSTMSSLSEMTPLAPLASDSSQEKTVERGGWVCKICDTRNADHDHFCKGCGASK